MKSQRMAEARGHASPPASGWRSASLCFPSASGSESESESISILPVDHPPRGGGRIAIDCAFSNYVGQVTADRGIENQEGADGTVVWNINPPLAGTLFLIK